MISKKQLINKDIAVDIDGVLTLTAGLKDFFNSTVNQHAKEFFSMKPNTKNINYVNKLFKHNTIILFTTRNNAHLNLTKKWLKQNKVKYHHLIMDKPYYDLLIDDKAINDFEVLK